MVKGWGEVMRGSRFKSQCGKKKIFCNNFIAKDDARADPQEMVAALP